MIIAKKAAIEIIDALIKANPNLVEKIYVGLENKPVPKSRYTPTVDKYSQKIIKEIHSGKFDKYLPYFPVLTLFSDKQTEAKVPDDFSIFLDSHVAFGALKPVKNEDIPQKKLGNRMLWDLSVSESHTSDIELSYYVSFYNYIKNDKIILDLIETLGGTSQTFSSDKKNFIEEERFDVRIPFEFSALTQSDDLRNIFYLELLNLKDPELVTIFLKKVVDKNLTVYQLGKNIIEKLPQTLTFSNQKRYKGSLVVVIDTSGSMRGAQEIISKYLALLVVEVCLPAQRSITLVSYGMQYFSYTINYYDSLNVIHSKVEEFLGLSYYGGTDVKSPVDAILDLTTKLEDFYYADVLLISDFLFKDYNISDIKSYKEFKNHGNRFIGLEINFMNIKNKRLPSFIDEHYIYFFNMQEKNQDNEKLLDYFSLYFYNKKDEKHNLFENYYEETKPAFYGFLRKVK